MDALILALAPGFAAGFAVQRLIEIADAVAAFLLPGWGNADGKLKHFVLAIVSLIAGLAIATWTGIRVLKPLGSTGPDSLDIFATALVISAGTEGVNSIVKFLGYKKEEQKKETDVVPKPAVLVAGIAPTSLALVVVDDPVEGSVG